MPLQKLGNAYPAKNQVINLCYNQNLYSDIVIFLKFFWDVLFYFLLLNKDGTTTGDGETIGNCPSSHSTYRCLSNGACNVCGLFSNKAEGCNIFSTTPVCDADSTTSGIQSSYDTAKVAQCVGCKKSG